MKQIYCICCILPLAAYPGFAAGGSYVVLNRSDNNSLVRVSVDGHFLRTMAEHAGGYGLAKDSGGNYIVATALSLLRVTPSGDVSTIAKAPRDSHWMRVVQESDGAFVVVDNRQHAVWRVSEDGKSIVKVANYWKPSIVWEGVSIILDESGKYLVIEDNDGSHLWQITPRGQVTPVPLQGVEMTSASSMIADGNGSYLIGSVWDRALFRMNRAGEVTKFADLDRNAQNLTGLARNPGTGEIVVTLNFAHSLLRISADGHTVSRLATDSRYLSYPTAVLFEPEK